jgi:O-antigen biosynthesis protein
VTPDLHLDDSRHQMVSCIMPTRNRRDFVGQSIAYFLRQDHSPRELIILDDGEDPVGHLVPADPRIRYVRLDSPWSLGAKRNLACRLARGEYIAHWDDDDWMAPRRLSAQLAQLQSANAPACAVANLLHYCPATGQAWRYRPLPQEIQWAAGCSLLYRKSVWEQHPFPEVNIGEDIAFLRACGPDRVHRVTDPSIYVSIIHPRNTSAKNLKDPRWQRRPLEEVSRLLWPDRDFYAWLRNGCPPRRAAGAAPSAAAPVGTPDAAGSTRQPRVSCIMPTRNRRAFVPQAIRYFLRQDYINKELVVVDDGDDAISDLLPQHPNIQYIRLSATHTIGVKRNLACEAATGDILLTWDDDDWYSPGRISHQVQPLLLGTADVTGLGNTLMLTLPTGQFWACTPQLYQHMFFQGVHGGTLAFWRELWLQGARFANASLAEEVPVQQALLRRGARLTRLPNPGIFVYVRHQTNAWQFAAGEFLDREGWSRAPTPSFLPPEDREFYGLIPEEGPGLTGSQPQGSYVVA